MYSSSGRKRGKYTGVSSRDESDDESSQGCSINLLTEDEESTAEFSGRVDWVVATQAALVNYNQNSGDIEEEEQQGLQVVSYPLFTMLSSLNIASSPSSRLSHRPSATSSSSLDTVASSPISPLPASLSNASLSPSNAFSFTMSSSSISTSPMSMSSYHQYQCRHRPHLYRHHPHQCRHHPRLCHHHPQQCPGLLFLVQLG